MSSTQDRNKIESAFSSLERVAAIVAEVCCCLIAIEVTINVIARYLFGKPMTLVWETSVSLLVIGVFLPLSYAQRTGKGHLSIDLVASRLSDKAQVYLNIITFFMCFSICSFLAWQTTESALYSWALGEFRHAIIPYPIYVDKTAIAVGFCLIAFRFLLLIVDNYYKLVGRA